MKRIVLTSPLFSKANNKKGKSSDDTSNSSPTCSSLLTSPAVSTISSLTESSLSSPPAVSRRPTILSTNTSSILNFFPKVDTHRDFALHPFTPVNIKNAELISCEQQIRDSHRAAAEAQNKRRVKSLAIHKGKIQKKNKIVAETIIGHSLLKSKRNTYSLEEKRAVVVLIQKLSSQKPKPSLCSIVEIVRNHEGYEKVSLKMCLEWLRQFSQKDSILQQKRGVKVNQE